MQHLGKIQDKTSWKSVSDTLNNNSDTLYEAITQLENATIKNAGYFLSEDALKKAVPNPTMGMIAYVRDVNSGVYYIWNTYLKGNVPTWTGTTTTVPEPNISMDAIEGLEASVQGVVDKQDELTNRVNTNSNDIGELQHTVNTHNTKLSSVDDDITALQQDKQDKLAHYTEEDENATIATRETISLHTAQQVGAASMSIDATTSEVEISSTNHNSEHARVLINNGNISIDADGKVSMSCDSGETVIEDVVGALVSNANAIATLTGTGKGSVSKTVTDEIAKIVDSAPEAFDTLKEIADYIAEDMSGAEEIVTSLGALNLRIYELGDFATAKDAEDKAREPLYSGNEGISIIHYTVNGSTDGLILQHQDVDGGYHRSVQTLLYHGRMYVRFVWFTDSTKTVLLENANFNEDWWETSISHLEYDKTTHKIKCRRIGQDVNSTKWITLPSASTSTDGLMTMAQVKSLEGKQDALQTYEETTDKAEVKMPNGNSYVRVTKDGAGMYAQDGKSGIVNSSSGSRLVYMETATDSSGDSYTSHRDDISIGKHSENSATHITLTSKSTTEEAGEKITNTSTIQVNPYGISMSSPNGEIGDIVKEISEKASSESVSELRQELATKAPKSGYAPDLKVNFAKELVGRGEATPEVIGNIRPTGEISIGDGNATIERIKGESVVWNQLEPNYNLLNNAISTACKNTTTIDGVVSVEGVTGYTAYIYTSKDKIKIYQGHKYLLSVETRSAESITNQLTIYDLTNNTRLVPSVQYKVDNTNWSRYSVISTAIKDGIGSLLVYPAYSQTLYNTLTDWQGRNFIVHDLTQMFGANNEPTTIEEFEARKPLGVTNEYNEGTIISYDGDALKSVGFNAFNGSYAKVIGGETYHATGTTSILFAKELGGDTTAITLDDKGKFTPEEDGYVYTEGTDIVIHLTHSYTPEHVDEYEEDVHLLPDVKSILDAEGNKLFPYGLLSAGSVHDEITATKAVKRVGVVDMGTLSWKYGKNSFWVHELHYAEVATAMPKSDFQSILVRYTKGESVNKITDKQYASGAANSYIYIYDSSYTSASDFKQAMSGVLLYYELATPIEVDLPEPLNMTYDAWDFGTEELVAEGATTPLNADIVYQFNAVDRIRENSSAIDDLKEHVEEHKDDGIELLTNGNLKLTLKGETKEFMPATPSGDPMHYAYVSAGAKYNDSDDFIVKDAPWKDMVDTIEDKAKWELDKVDASKVKQMTIKGVVYNYATENRTSPEGGTHLRYFIVGQSNGVWVENETKVLHLPKCWYLNGLGDITNAEMRRIVENKYIISVWEKHRAIQSIKARTLLNPYTLAYTGGLGVISNLYDVSIESVTLYTGHFKIVSLEYCIPTTAIVGNQRNLKYFACVKNLTSITHTNVRVLPINKLANPVNISSPVISKESVLQTILNATPTSAITITLHHDAYARLVDDADIVAALEAKPLVTLVSA